MSWMQLAFVVFLIPCIGNSHFSYEIWEWTVPILKRDRRELSWIFLFLRRCLCKLSSMDASCSLPPFFWSSNCNESPSSGTSQSKSFNGDLEKSLKISWQIEVNECIWLVHSRVRSPLEQKTKFKGSCCLRYLLVESTWKFWSWMFFNESHVTLCNFHVPWQQMLCVGFEDYLHGPEPVLVDVIPLLLLLLEPTSHSAYSQ